MRFRTTVTFEELGGKTRVTWQGRFPTAAERNRVIAEHGADKGLTQTMSRLGQYLENQARKDPTMMAQTQPQEPVFTTTRVFDAPRDLVWAAWTDPKHLMQWWGPKGFTVVKCDMDLRVGGLFHYALKGPDGRILWGKWTFREIVKPERLTCVTSFSDEKGGETRHPMAPTWPLTTLSTTTFEAQGAKTALHLRWTPLNPTEEERKTFAASTESMKQGWGGTMDQLAAYLAKVR